MNGAGGRKTGRNGKDITLDVPVGTVAIDPDGAVIADLEHPGAKAVIARGGSGGRGNVHFKSSTRHAPDYAEPGLKGEELAVTLDLKLTYLRPLSVRSGNISAEGKIIKLGRQTSYTEGFVRDGAGHLAVHATANFSMIGEGPKAK